MGNVQLSSSSSQPTTIQNVLHIRRLLTNLLSVSHIIEQGYGVYFDNSNVEVVRINNLQIAASGKTETRLHWHLNSFTSPLISSRSHLLQLLCGSYALVAQEYPLLFGYRNFDFLQKLSSFKIVHGLSHFNVSNISCVTGLYTWEAPLWTFSFSSYISCQIHLGICAYEFMWSNATHNSWRCMIFHAYNWRSLTQCLGLLAFNQTWSIL